MNNYDAVFWDWNGTLLDDIDACLKSVNVSLSKRSLPVLDSVTYAEKFRFPVKDYYRELGFDFSKDSYEVLAGEFFVNYLTVESPLRTDAKKVLEKLFLNSVKQYILSASEISLLKQGVQKFGIGVYFTDLIALSDFHAAGKTEVGKRYLETHPVKGKILMVGDTEHDAEVARALGIDCVLIESGNNSLQRLQATGAKVIASLSELIEIVLGKKTVRKIDYMTPEKAERRNFDLSEVNRKFAENYHSFYNDVKNTNKTEDW